MAVASCAATRRYSFHGVPISGGACLLPTAACLLQNVRRASDDGIDGVGPQNSGVASKMGQMADREAVVRPRALRPAFYLWLTTKMSESQLEPEEPFGDRADLRADRFICPSRPRSVFYGSILVAWTAHRGRPHCRKACPHFYGVSPLQGCLRTERWRASLSARDGGAHLRWVPRIKTAPRGAVCAKISRNRPAPPMMFSIAI